MSEHHSHRTDEEWRAIIRNWKDRLRAYCLVDGPSIVRKNVPIPATGVLRIIEEMEKELG